MKLRKLTDRELSVVLRRRQGEPYTSISKSLGRTSPLVRALYYKAEALILELHRTKPCPCCGAPVQLYDVEDGTPEPNHAIASEIERLGISYSLR